MQVSSLPTDNLYKFCAILGLTLMIFNTYYNFEMKSNSIEKSIELDGESKKYLLEIYLLKNKQFYSREKYKILNKDLKKYEKEVNSTITEINNKQFSLNELTGIRYKIRLKEHRINQKISELDSLNKIIKKDSKFLDFKSIDISTKKQLIDNEKSKINKYSFFLIIGVVIGVFLSFYGFYNWRKNEILNK